MNKVFIFLFGTIALVISIMFLNSGSGELIHTSVFPLMGQKIELENDDSSIYLYNDLDNKMFKVILTGPVQNRFTFDICVSGEVYYYNKLSKDLIILSQSEVEKNDVESSNKDELIFYVKYSDDIYQKIINYSYSVTVCDIRFAGMNRESN